MIIGFKQNGKLVDSEHGRFMVTDFFARKSGNRGLVRLNSGELTSSERTGTFDGNNKAYHNNWEILDCVTIECDTP